MANERQTGKQRADAISKYWNDLKDAVEYHQYVKESEKDKEQQMERAHKDYIA